MAFLDRFRQKKEDSEAVSRNRLLQAGRIAEGSVLDIGTDSTGDIIHIFYTYSVSGVEYESSQVLDQEQRARQSDYTPGARITVRFDPRQPGNSIVV
jgi:hypothetical protein